MSVKTMSRPEKYDYLYNAVLPALRRYIKETAASYRYLSRRLREHGARTSYESIRLWVEGDGFPTAKNADALVELLREEKYL